jgi:hypothetical protein
MVELAIFSGNLMSDTDVGSGVKRGQKIELLEHKADFAFAQRSTFRIGKLSEIHAIDEHASTSGAGKTSENVEERRLSAAGRTYDTDEFAAFHIETRPTQRGHVNFADVINFADVLCLDNVGHGKFSVYTTNPGRDAARRVLRTVQEHGGIDTANDVLRFNCAMLQAGDTACCVSTGQYR